MHYCELPRTGTEWRAGKSKLSRDDPRRVEVGKRDRELWKPSDFAKIESPHEVSRTRSFSLSQFVLLCEVNKSREADRR